MAVARRWDENDCKEKLDISCPLCHQICGRSSFKLLYERPAEDIDAEKTIVRKIVDGKCLVCGKDTRSYPTKFIPNVAHQHIHCLCGVCLPTHISSRNHYFPSSRGCRILFLRISTSKRKRTESSQSETSSVMPNTNLQMTSPRIRRYIHVPKNFYERVINPSIRQVRDMLFFILFPTLAFR